MRDRTLTRDTVFVFARAPRLGAVKRRLAREIGARTALDFHRATMIALLRGLAAEQRFRTVLALTPDRARFPLPVRVARVGQGCGDLGARMQRAASRVKRGRVVIIGCDIPDARTADVLAAFRALRCADAVFGPAEDGGYWLVGLSPRRPARPFAAVRWSTAHALSDTLANFRGRRLAFLRTLRDVDTASDLRSLRR
jgi:rSAM/selenodomain-associated transferase 1